LGFVVGVLLFAPVLARTFLGLAVVPPPLDTFLRARFLAGPAVFLGVLAPAAFLTFCATFFAIVFLIAIVLFC
jgi:hypothetical protein